MSDDNFQSAYEQDDKISITYNSDNEDSSHDEVLREWRMFLKEDDSRSSSSSREITADDMGTFYYEALDKDNQFEITTPQLRIYTDQYFKLKKQFNKSFLSKNEFQNFLKSSHLSNSEIGKISDVVEKCTYSEISSNNYLIAKFTIMMHLAIMRLRGHSIPNELPSCLNISKIVDKLSHDIFIDKKHQSINSESVVNAIRTQTSINKALRAQLSYWLAEKNRIVNERIGLEKQLQQ